MVVTASALFTVRVNGAESVWLAESVTCTVKLALPFAVGVPVRTPALERLRFSGVSVLPPAVTVHVYPVPEPPVAANVCEYALFATPVFSGLVVVIDNVG